MNQELHYLQKDFITVGAIFVDEIDINDVLNDITSADVHHQGFCYTFKAEIDSNFAVGDYAVVHARDELKIVKIVQVHQTPKIDIHAKFEYKWVIQKIDFRAFKARHQEQQRIETLLNALEVAERKQALAERLNKMSAKDDNFAKILNETLPNNALQLIQPDSQPPTNESK